MKNPSSRRRLMLALVVAGGVAGVAAGLLVGRGHSANTRSQGTPRVVAQGAFHAVTWNTTGTASVVRTANGNFRLRLSSDFTTKQTPELFVYLAKLRGQQKVYWKLVAALKSTQGAQTYPVSSDAASTAGLEVAIYCGKCNQINALAPL